MKTERITRWHDCNYDGLNIDIIEVNDNGSRRRIDHSTFTLEDAYLAIKELTAKVEALEAKLEKHSGDFQTHNILIGCRRNSMGL